VQQVGDAPDQHCRGKQRERRRQGGESARTAVGEGPTAAAETAVVELVALTTSDRELPSSA